MRTFDVTEDMMAQTALFLDCEAINFSELVMIMFLSGS